MGPLLIPPKHAMGGEVFLEPTESVGQFHSCFHENFDKHFEIISKFSKLKTETELTHTLSGFDVLQQPPFRRSAHV